ncbi:hypothetical protein A3D23_02040 [candidate division WOR-1 bacterium RIFCSPHIGHO2_02_FULL_53_26]|nr:MAG: hypothetical protein A3D23_02040 [candidate division WOR-1 bacterium RIFCSPHIGHO2_02_FULL_53_26]
MRLGRNGLHAPGLRSAVIKNNFKAALDRSRGNATTYPIDHIEEHGPAHYFVRGMLRSFDPGAVVEVAREGGVMAMAVLPGLGQQIGQLTKGDMPLIWKLNRGSGAKVNGDATTVRLYSDVDKAMSVAVDNGARFWGATFYNGSANVPDMIQQLAEMDEAGARHGLGGVVWNYPRGSEIPKGHDADIMYQLEGFERIINACPGSLVLVKEKVSTLPGTVADWEAGEIEKVGRGEGAWGKPGTKGVKDEVVRTFLAMNRAVHIAFMVELQHNQGIASLMSGGAPQEREKFEADLNDGIGPDRHVAFIAGRSTTNEIKYQVDEYDISGAVRHMHMLRDAAPKVVIEG